MKHVSFFRHALALDERRVKFLPEYAYGDSTLGPEDGVWAAETMQRSGPQQDIPPIKEVWFPGTHSEV